MKKIIAIIVAALMMTVTFVSVSAETVDEGELIIRLFDPASETVDPWLANVADALTIEEVDGKTALKHATWDTSWGSSLSMKRYYEVDWSQYEYDRILFVADIYVEATPVIDYDISGEFKVKFGDGSDTHGNTSEQYQYYESVVNLELVNGWNHLEIPLCELFNNENSDELWRESDWFCLWMKSTFHTFDVAIARLDVVYTAESLETEAPVETTEEVEDTTAEPEETSAAPEETTAAPEESTAAPKEDGGCGSTLAASAVVVALVGTFGCAVIKKK